MAARRSRYLRVHMGLRFAFLYLPIVVLVVLSFNDSELATVWGGFSTRWYRDLVGNEELIAAIKNSLIVAGFVTAIATVLGTLLAIGLQRTVRSRVLDSVLSQTYRNLQVQTTYTGQTFKHILVPIWLLSYTYRGRSYQVVGNGVTGSMAGEHPWSWIKIALLVIAALIVIYLIQSS